MSAFEAPGQRLARGVCRYLRGAGYAPLTELTLDTGLRVDLMAVGPRGEVWIVECKSSRQDFNSDRKWTGYLEWCDRFFWAVPSTFPTELLPCGAGLIFADDYGAELRNIPDPNPLASARRRAVSLRFARTAAERLAALRDPQVDQPI